MPDPPREEDQRTLSYDQLPGDDIPGGHHPTALPRQPSLAVHPAFLPVLSSLCTEKADCQHWAEFCISADTDWPTILLLACPYKAESHPSPPFILFISFPRYKLKLVMSTEIYLVLVLLDQFDQSNPSFS